MIYDCKNCRRQFDADTKPISCSFCKTTPTFAQITIRDKNGREITYAEHIEDLRQYIRPNWWTL